MVQAGSVTCDGFAVRHWREGDTEKQLQAQFGSFGLPAMLRWMNIREGGMAGQHEFWVKLKSD